MRLFNKIMSIACFFASGFNCAMLINALKNNDALMTFIFTCSIFYYLFIGKFWLEEKDSEYRFEY